MTTGTPVPDPAAAAAGRERRFASERTRSGHRSTASAEACAAALPLLPGAGPAALVALLRLWDPREAWERVLRGQLHQLEMPRAPQERRLASWAAAAARIDPSAIWERAVARGIQVTWYGHPRYPDVLLNDPSPPGVLYWRGDIDSLSRMRVAIVGTRNATPDGRSIAYGMGRELAGAGVCVVSGLALGIDGSAHRGALEARAGSERCRAADRGELSMDPPAAPVGIAASGVDVPYPRQHRQLWDEVVACGAVMSETPPGRAAEAWRFPMRNRVIAALCQLVVVVESHKSGGSLITAEAAMERGIDVRVVPGPVHSPASAGSNQLLYDGPGPVRDATDVLDALGLIRPPPPPRGPRGASGPLTPREAAVVNALGWRPTSLNQVVRRSGVGVAAASADLDRLEARGLVGREGGWWVRRAGSLPRSAPG